MASQYNIFSHIFWFDGHANWNGMPGPTNVHVCAHAHAHTSYLILEPYIKYRNDSIHLNFNVFYLTSAIYIS